MYMNDYDDPPQIIWEENDRYAIIVFLLLSVDRKMNAEDLKKFDTFLGITGAEVKHDDDEEDDIPTELALRDAIIREGGVFLDGINQDENRYDCIMDEIDRVIDGSEKCNIGNGYAQEGCNKLPGTTCQLFDYLKLVFFDTQYSGDRKRLLQHLARKWDIEKNVLPILEKSLKSLDEINRKRTEIENSDTIYRDAISNLDKLDTNEKAVWDKLNELNISKEQSSSPFRKAPLSGLFRAKSVSGIQNISNNESAEESLVDKIGDYIVEGIYKIGDLICAPLEWMSGVR